MARLSFGRTVYNTFCEVVYYDENNEKQETVVKLYGNYDFDDAVGPVKNELGTKRFIIENIRHTSFYGKMTYEDFAKVCEKSNVKEW